MKCCSDSASNPILPTCFRKVMEVTWEGPGETLRKLKNKGKKLKYVELQSLHICRRSFRQHPERKSRISLTSQESKSLKPALQKPKCVNSMSGNQRSNGDPPNVLGTIFRAPDANRKTSDGGLQGCLPTRKDRENKRPASADSRDVPY